MGDIFDEANHKLGKVGQDGYVFNATGNKIGRILDNGDVQNAKWIKIGSYDGSGRVFEGTRHIGDVHGDGKVYDYEKDMIGLIKGDHIMGGGAALLLLFR